MYKFRLSERQRHPRVRRVSLSRKEVRSTGCISPSNLYCRRPIAALQINVGLCQTDGHCQSRPYRVQSARREAEPAGIEPALSESKSDIVTSSIKAQYIYVRHFVCAARKKRNPARNLFCHRESEQHIFCEIRW